MFIASYPLNFRRAVFTVTNLIVNEPMVLFHNIIEVQDYSEFSSFGKSLVLSESITGE
jgi:hypothetical protein